MRCAFLSIQAHHLTVRQVSRPTSKQALDDGSSEAPAPRTSALRRPPMPATPRGWRPLPARRFALSWSFTARAGEPIWALALLSRGGATRDLLAVTCGNSVQVHRVNVRGSSERERRTQLQRVTCADDELHALAWLHVADTLLLAVAGKSGVVRLVDVARGALAGDLTGHGSEVFALAAHPTLGAVLASGSRDHSVRVWDAERRACVALFEGHRGHCQPVTCLAWAAAARFGERGEHCTQLVSGGIDQAVCVWDALDALADRTPHAPPRVVQSPVFATRRVHDNYIDDVHAWDHSILSRSADNRLVLWEPVVRPGHRADGLVLPRRHFDLGARAGAAPWWLKCAAAANLILAGTRHGALLVWDRYERGAGLTTAERLERGEPPVVTLAPPADAADKPVRTVVAEEDGRYVVCGGDGGQVWLFVDEASG